MPYMQYDMSLAEQFVCLLLNDNHYSLRRSPVISTPSCSTSWSGTFSIAFCDHFIAFAPFSKPTQAVTLQHCALPMCQFKHESAVRG